MKKKWFYAKVGGKNHFISRRNYYRLGSSALVEGNSEFKPVKLHLKIDLVSYPAWAEGMVNMITDADYENNLVLFEKYPSLSRISVG